MKVKTISGGITAEGIHYSSHGEVEVPDDFWTQMLDALALASRAPGGKPTRVLVSPSMREYIKAAVVR